MTPAPDARPGFYEFFAGGGMARAGLGAGWRCLFANDFDAKKGLAYQANWGAGGALRIGDVRTIHCADLPGRADLVWASFPCQDLSLAGGGAGLGGARSGAFFPFWDIVRGLIAEGRGPRLVALENVCGALTSHGGRDFRALCAALAGEGYRVGALVIDAALFVPQSRPRLFVIGASRGVGPIDGLVAPEPVDPFHTPRLRAAARALTGAAAEAWVWWNVPTPPRRTLGLADLVEEDPADVRWMDAAETERLIGLMSPQNLAKLATARRAGRRMVGTVYRRTRIDAAGRKAQRAEVRFDDVAGCLRTPAGGSSRQTILVVDGERVRARLISARETARLMGLDDAFRLPRAYNDAYRLTGDGVVVPVVRHLAARLFEPLVAGSALDHAAGAAGRRRA